MGHILFCELRLVNIMMIIELSLKTWLLSMQKSKNRAVRNMLIFPTDVAFLDFCVTVDFDRAWTPFISV